MVNIREIAQNAKEATRPLLSIGARNFVLRCMAEELVAERAKIMEANKRDLDAISSTCASNDPLVKRLSLTSEKFDDLVAGLATVEKLKDPLGGIICETELADGLRLQKVPAPLGVLCIIYEARPEAGVQIASLAVKSGNTLILKGGKEAHESNAAIFNALQAAIAKAHEKYPEVSSNILQMVETRADIAELLKMDEYIDVVIPRGSNSLVKSVKDQTKIMVIGHADGICAMYVDSEIEDLHKAVSLIVDGKTQYVAACNSIETLLIHQSKVKDILPALASAVHHLKFRADSECIKYLPQDRTTEATEEDFKTEFLDYILAVKAVASVQDAIKHINSHGSHHTDCIISNNQRNIHLFLNQVDSAGVYANASTRFADGYRYGFGAEVGIATSKVHCRGPVGLDGLVLYKYKLIGDGHTVSEMGKTRTYTHKNIPIRSP